MNASGLALNNANIILFTLIDVSGRIADAIDHKVSDPDTGP